MNGLRCYGFSLIEHLVALAVLALGVLGMAGLQLAALQQARSSLLQGEATFLAADLLERIRANPSAVYGLGFAEAPGAVADCAGRLCSSEEMRAYDLALWRCAINSRDAGGGELAVCTSLGVAGALPGGGCVDETAACAGGAVALAGGLYTVTVRWAEPAGARTVTLRARQP